MKLRHVLVGSALALGIPGVASAQELPTGPYIGGALGYQWLDDFEVTETTPTQELEFDNNLSYLAELGYRFGNGFRVGAEYSYAAPDLESVTVGNTSTFANGELTAHSLMGVAYFEFPLGPVRPYIGAGAGVVKLKAEDLSAPVFGQPNEEKDTAFAYQVGAGLGYGVSDNFEVFASYRYLDASDVKLGTRVGRVETDYQSHTAFVGVRYTFGAAPPPPPPAPIPAAAPPPPPPPPPPPAPIARNYTVFFDWDRSDLTPDAQQVLRSVAADARAGRVATIQVTGYTDTSGPPDYNQRLSIARAESVREYLVSIGLSGTDIAINGVGETELLVPTADGVREPSNRRAVIIFPENQPSS